MSKITLLNVSCIELIDHIEEESVDLILTDPPYPKEYLHCWKELAQFAAHALKEGGSLVTLSGQVWFNEVIKILDAEPTLKYWWTHCLYHAGAGVSDNRGRNICHNRWKPILWYIKTKRTKHSQYKDYYISEHRDKRYHNWGQSEKPSIQLANAYTEPGQLIVDPFLGGGTNAIAAINAKCDFIGADIDATNIDIVNDRINDPFSLKRGPNEDQEQLTLEVTNA